MEVSFAVQLGFGSAGYFGCAGYAGYADYAVSVRRDGARCVVGG